MADLDPADFVVAGSGNLYIAPVGSSLPVDENDDVEALGFEGLGYVTEDGLTFGWSPEVQEFFSWQSRTATRRELTGHEYNFTFELQQWRQETLKAAFGGGDVSQVSSGHYRFDFLSDVDQLSEYALVADWSDGDKHYRLVMPRVNATEGAEVQLTRSALALLPVSFKALAPGGDLRTAYLLTDDPAFAPTGS